MSSSGAKLLERDRRGGPNRLVPPARVANDRVPATAVADVVPRQLPSSAVDELCDAASSGNLRRVREQLRNGVRVNDADVDGMTALMTASFAGKPHVVKLLLNQGAEVDIQDESGQTALMNAVIGLGEFEGATQAPGHAQVIELLLAAGADRSLRDAARFTALDYALYHRLHELTERLATD